MFDFQIRDQFRSLHIKILLLALAVLFLAWCGRDNHRGHDELHALGTTNTISKFTGTASIGNSSVTDDGTTFAINTNKFTVTESSGATLAAGNITLGAGANVLSGGTPTSNHGSVTAGSTNLAGRNTGNGANTSTTVTFSSAFPNSAFCTVSDCSSASSAQTFQVDANASVFVVTCYNPATGVAANCNDFCWHCVGR